MIGGDLHGIFVRYREFPSRNVNLSETASEREKILD